MDSIKTVLDEAQREHFESKRTLVKGRCGEATMHHPLTVHGSDRNASDRPRRAVVVNLTSADTRCDVEGEALLDGLPVMAKGALLEGRFFPRLVSASVAEAAMAETQTDVAKAGGDSSEAGFDAEAVTGAKRPRDDPENHGGDASQGGDKKIKVVT